MKEQKWTNYGIIKPRFSTYSPIKVDAKRGKAYAMVVPFAPVQVFRLTNNTAIVAYRSTIKHQKQ
jgi:hypothetical protein